jgi:hypothetical protein
MGYVRAKTSFVTTVKGKRVRVRKTDLPRRDNDPVVKAVPNLFIPLDDGVEDASAAPGRKRRRTKPVKKAESVQTTPAVVSEDADGSAERPADD